MTSERALKLKLNLDLDITQSEVGYEVLDPIPFPCKIARCLCKIQQESSTTEFKVRECATFSIFELVRRTLI